MTPEEDRAARQALWVCAHLAGAPYEVLQRAEKIAYRPGSFIEALLAAWLRADLVNAATLGRAFPPYAKPMTLYRTKSLIALLEYVEHGGGDD